MEAGLKPVGQSRLLHAVSPEIFALFHLANMLE